MGSQFDTPGRVVGVDFSAATDDAGANTWLATGEATGRGLRVEELAPAEAYLDGAPRTRGRTLESLLSFLQSLGGGTAVGLDFPFGIPAPLVDATSWGTFVDGFADRFPDADAYAAECVSRTRAIDPDRTYLKRATDERVGSRSPYGFVVDTIAYYGVRDLLAPLLAAGGVRVVPMQDPAPDATLLLETYPAATLERFGLCGDRYKGGGGAERDRRRRNVEGLRDGGPLSVPPDLRAAAVADAGGDAVDALAAAAAAFRATRSMDRVRVDEPAAAIEGWIYV